MRLGIVPVMVLMAAVSGCDSSAGHHSELEALAGCAPGPRLTTISDVVARANALPDVGPSCLLASLARPLEVVTSLGATSAQPAEGPESPRLLIVEPELVLTFVPAGEGAPLVELGEFVEPARTLKGELQLPRQGVLAGTAPFDRVRFSSPATTCGLCHRDERPSGDTPGGYVSAAYRPLPNLTRSVSTLEVAHEHCAATTDRSERCLMLHALFDFGPVHDGVLPSELGTFGQ